MLGEIIAIGDELTSGRIVNTTSGFAARHLFSAGHEIFAMHTIGDTPTLIGEALKRAISRVDFVIVTGGLGSTTDDMTNEAVAKALGRPVTLYKEILDNILQCSDKNTKTISNLEKLAWLPKGAEVLSAQSKMAGYMLVHEFTPIFFLPGIPAQMKELLLEHVLPRLTRWITSNRNHVRHRVYKVFGLHEHEINSSLEHLEETSGVKIGYYPVGSEVHVSLTVLNQNGPESNSLFTRAEQEILKTLGPCCYGTNQDSMASVVGEQILTHNYRISIAESCTGGLISSKITKVSGSSDWFEGGVIAYSNQLKIKLLQVESDLLEEHGAVSPQVARAMAAGVARQTGSDIGLSVTGIAGPAGGTDDKPVGTAYIGLSLEKNLTDHLFHFSGDRLQIQELTALTALDLVRRALSKIEGDSNGIGSK